MEFLEYLKLAEKYDAIEIPRIKYLGGSFISGFQGVAKKRQEFLGLNELWEMRKFILGLTEDAAAKQA